MNLISTSLGWAAALAAAAAGGLMVGSTVVQTNHPNGLQIFTLRPNADLDGLIKEFGLKPRHMYRHVLNGFAALLDSAQAGRLRQDSCVVAVEPDGKAVLADQSIPAGVLRMGITNFPLTRVNGRDNRISVDVAVLDTGIQTNHPDLNVVQGVDCTGAELNGDDWHGHGTLMAGVIGALDNGLGVVGVAPGVHLWAVQVFGPGTNFGSWASILAGMEYVAMNTDRIEAINASFYGGGSDTPYEALHQAISNLVSRGVVFVACAGNDGVDIAGGDRTFGTDDDYVPAGFSEVMAVSAMNPSDDTMAYFSNSSSVPKVPSYVASPGAGIDVAAPGVDILSTVPGSGYGIGSGTSEACAHATGLVALYIAANGRATNAQGVYNIRQAIIDQSLPQSAWATVGATGDSDGNPELLAMPSEAWVPTPTILSESMTPEGLKLQFPAVPGYTYTPQYAGSLSQSNQWMPLTSTNGSGSLSTVRVTDPTPEPASRFYRLARQPSP